MGRTGHHEDCVRPNFGILQNTETIIMWVGLGIMKTVAVPIYCGLLQSTDTIIPMPIKK